MSNNSPGTEQRAANTPNRQQKTPRIFRVVLFFYYAIMSRILYIFRDIFVQAKVSQILYNF